MLRKLYVDNYKCLVNFEIEFQDLCLLLGRNGVGKSSIFDVVFAIRSLLGGRAKIEDPGVFPPSSLTRWDQRRQQKVELTVALEDDVLTYRLELEHDQDLRKSRVTHESLTAGGQPLFEFVMGQARLFKDDHRPGPTFLSDWGESGLARVVPVPENKRLTRFLDWARRILVCGFYPRSFVAEASSEDPVLERDGHNFSAWYRHVFQERQDLVPSYIEALKRVIPGFEGINLERAGRDTRVFLARLREHGQSFTLALDELSDGQRALLAIYALAHITAGQGYTLFLDEPDNYVAIVEIQPWLEVIADAAGATIPQVVVCSHHPEMIDFFGGNRTLILAREGSSPVRVSPPDQEQLAAGIKLSELVARGWVS